MRPANTDEDIFSCIQWFGPMSPFGGLSGRSRHGPKESAYNQEATFAGVKILLSEGPESTQNGHSSLLMRTSAIRSQNGRSITPLS